MVGTVILRYNVAAVDSRVYRCEVNRSGISGRPTIYGRRVVRAGPKSIGQQTITVLHRTFAQLRAAD